MTNEQPRPAMQYRPENRPNDDRTVTVYVARLNQPTIEMVLLWRDAWVSTILERLNIPYHGDRLSVGGRYVCTGTLLRNLDVLRVWDRNDADCGSFPVGGGRSDGLENQGELPSPTDDEDEEEEEPEPAACEHCDCYVDEDWDGDCNCRCHCEEGCRCICHD